MNGSRQRGPSALLLSLGAIILVLGTLVFIPGCGGPKGLAPKSALDTPESHYAQGQKYLAAGKIDQAMTEFNRSVELARGAKRKFAPGYEGMGLAYLAAGDLQASRQMLEKSQGEDEKYAPAYTGMGRLYDAEKNYEKALKEFAKATTLAPKSADPHFWSGETCIHMQRYDDAESSFQQALKLEPSNAAANARWEELQRSRRALAGAPPEYTAIAHSPAITRADMAALLVREINLAKVFKQAPAAEAPGFAPPPSTMGKKVEAAAPSGPADIEGHWAASYVQEVLASGLLESYPDGNFRPSETMTRADFAMVVEQVLAKALADDGLATRYIGTTSPLSDVPGSHFAYNAIMVATTRGIMKARLDGSFGLRDPVPGTDALLMLRTLKEQLP